MTAVNLCSGNGMSASYRELMPQFERARNCTVAMHFEPGQMLLREIKAGRAADLLTLGKGTMDELVKEGHVGATLRVLKRNGIGIGDAIRAKAKTQPGGLGLASLSY